MVNPEPFLDRSAHGEEGIAVHVVQQVHAEKDRQGKIGASKEREAGSSGNGHYRADRGRLHDVEDAFQKVQIELHPQHLYSPGPRAARAVPLQGPARCAGRHGSRSRGVVVESPCEEPLKRVVSRGVPTTRSVPSALRRPTGNNPIRPDPKRCGRRWHAGIREDGDARRTAPRAAPRKWSTRAGSTPCSTSPG